MPCREPEQGPHSTESRQGPVAGSKSSSGLAGRSRGRWSHWWDSLALTSEYELWQRVEAGAGKQLDSFIKCSLAANPREAAVWGTQIPYLLAAPQSQENAWLGFTQPGALVPGAFPCGFPPGVPSLCAPRLPTMGVVLPTMPGSKSGSGSSPSPTAAAHPTLRCPDQAPGGIW